MKNRNNIGLGTAAIGRPLYINIKKNVNAESFSLTEFRQKGFAILEKAYQLGIRYFDTAPGYGLAEGLVLEWLQTKNDSTIKIATKWGYTYIADFNPNAKVHEVKEHSLSKLNEQWGVSKAFLPHLSTYQIHSATLETGVLESEMILNQLAFLKEEYNMKIGITTTGVNQVEVIKKALDVSVQQKPLFDAFQVTYNILDQSLKNISHKLENEGKAIIIKEALANGRLLRNKNYGHYIKLYNFMETLATKYNVGVDAIALNFCSLTMSKGIILSGASNDIHLEDNIKTNLFKLTEEEINKLHTFNTNEVTYWNERKGLTWN